VRFLLGWPSSSLTRTVRLTLIGGVFFFAGPPVASTLAQSATSQVPTTPQADASPNAPKPAAKATDDEIVARDSQATFKVHVNLVPIRVVVRDSKGKVVTNLKKDDFQLADDGKLQSISSFSIDTSTSQAPSVKTDSVETASEGTPAKVPELPQRFITLFFDDLHLSTQDVMLSRQAATKLFAAVGTGDRLGIFTTSGQVNQDFTADRAKLEDALQRILPRSLSSAGDCPPMTFYEAYQIVYVNDPDALQVAIEDLQRCAGPEDSRTGQLLAQQAAQRKLDLEESQLQVTYQNLEAVIRSMTALPGQRVIVMMSPGFFVTPSMHWSGEIIDRATKGNVVINTIDARGLYVPNVYDASNPGALSPLETRFITMEEMLQDDVLSEFADGTGGIFFHNRNDIDRGLLQAAAEPEVSYLLGFTPQNLKLDGKYHHLKVTLTSNQQCALQARHGYFAPRGEADPDARAKEEIQLAVFSQEEMRELPVECQTQFFKTDNGAHLTVITHLGTRELRFRKADERNKDTLTFTTVIFDDNGKMLAGLQRVIDVQVKDPTLERMNKTGLNVKLSFDLQSGKFLVRTVVRDSEGAQIGATNRAIVIP
jgi:VWFA-related protein